VFCAVTSLHKHCTITQNTADTPQTSMHKHGTIKQITADIPQTSLHKHGNVRSDLCYCPCLCNEVRGMSGVF
jgi:hypothetical protein